jgi:hypothetical protein
MVEVVIVLAILSVVVLAASWFFSPYPARVVGYAVGWLIGWAIRGGRRRRA